MFNQAFVVEVLANEHRKDLLKEANANRITRPVKKQAGLWKSLVARLVRLQTGPGPAQQLTYQD